MVKAKEIGHVDGDNTALSEIASPRSSKIRSTFADGTTMTAIPNYARLKRGGKRSIVWIRNQ